MLLPVKRGLLWLARWTGSVENGPTTLMMTVTILVMFGSAFCTDAIGMYGILMRRLVLIPLARCTCYIWRVSCFLTVGCRTDH